MALKFDYYYLESSEVYSDDYPPPLVLVVPSLDIEVLLALARFLIDNFELQYNIEDSDTHLDARPILIGLSASHFLNEKTFWSMLIDILDGAEDLIVEYVEKHTQRALSIGREAMGFCTAQDMVGQAALYAYFDSRTPDGYRTTSDEEKERQQANFVKVSDCFLKFLKNCDMDHEVCQHDYIIRTLDYLKRFDIPRFLDLLMFRLFSGQVGLSGMEFNDKSRFLNHSQLLNNIGVFKLVVDRYIESERLHWDSRLDLLHLCAVVYGSNYELTEDVLAYCEQKIKLERNRCLINFNNELHMCRMLRDMKLQVTCRGAWRINTGFHEWSPEHRCWKRIEAVFEGI